MGWEHDSETDAASESEQQTDTESSGGESRTHSRTSPSEVLRQVQAKTSDEHSSSPGPDTSGPMTDQEYEQYYGVDIDKPAQVDILQRLEETNGVAQVRQWANEGIPIDAMGTPSQMQAYRQRKGTPVPWDAEKRNKQSKRRNELVQRVEAGKPAGDTKVPNAVRDVISSPGQSLDGAVQREMEDRMGDSFGDVQVHTGPKAAQACDDINARAFTVGNNIAFNSGEYNPESQHVIAHELAHVRQQTSGAVSMLPQDDVELEIDPDPKLEEEAEETAQRVMQGGELGIQRLADTEVHVQRDPQTPLYAFDDDGHTGEFVGDVTESLSEHSLLDADKIDGIPADIGKDISGTIRAAINPDSENDLRKRTNRNIAFAIVDVDNTVFSLAAVSGTSAPGYTVPYKENESERRFEANSEWMNTHAEMKLLEQIFAKIGSDSDGEIYIFTEQKPCGSCKGVISDLRDSDGLNIDVSINHHPAMEDT